MTYWRMQLHPDDSKHAVQHTIESLNAGYIGLDFDQAVGDLTKLTKEQLPNNQHDYWDFAHKIHIGDLVLIIAHHLPFALVTVSGKYNYIRQTAPEIGVWFRHFRAIKNVKYYFDYVTNINEWEKLIMTDTISILNDADKDSYKLIEKWKD